MIFQYIIIRFIYIGYLNFYDMIKVFLSSIKGDRLDINKKRLCFIVNDPIEIHNQNVFVSQKLIVS